MVFSFVGRGDGLDCLDAVRGARLHDLRPMKSARSLWNSCELLPHLAAGNGKHDIRSAHVTSSSTIRNRSQATLTAVPVCTPLARSRLDFCVHCRVERQCCSVAHPVALEMPDECTDHTSTNQHAAVSRDDMDVSVRVGEETRKTFEEDT